MKQSGVRGADVAAKFGMSRGAIDQLYMRIRRHGEAAFDEFPESRRAALADGARSRALTRDSRNRFKPRGT
jgi:hypothetical protein